MKKIALSIILIMSISIMTAQTEAKVYASLLKNYVSSNGKVDYAGLKKNEDLLDIYLEYLNNVIPQKKWSSNQAKAYWLNVYNANTLKIVLKNYPINSIKDIKDDGKDAWGISVVKAGKYTYNLDHIEHKVLRQWHYDPRIHVGLNSASVSGSRFPNFIFTKENVDNKLDYLMKVFLNDASKNKITPSDLKLSKVFQWYKEDFTETGNIVDFLNKYSRVKINNNATINYLEYDWGLNEFIKK